MPAERGRVLQELLNWLSTLDYVFLTFWVLIPLTVLALLLNIASEVIKARYERSRRSQ